MEPDTPPRIDDVELSELFEVDPIDADTYSGMAVRYRFPRLYGGHVLAQALAAAARTVDPRFGVHSLHGYFIRPGTAEEPVTYRIDRLRDGRSFVTRSVVARQSGGAILHASCSFQVDEEGVDVPGAERPGARPPDSNGLVRSGWGPLDRRAEPGSDGAIHWLRLTDDLGDDPIRNACGLVFLSDSMLMTAARRSHPDTTGDERDRTTFTSASLDHALWFHRPSRVNDWHLSHVESHGLVSGRGVVTGTIFSDGGVQVATVAQEALVRRRREPL